MLSTASLNQIIHKNYMFKCLELNLSEKTYCYVQILKMANPTPSEFFQMHYSPDESEISALI